MHKYADLIHLKMVLINR